jgi:hypothetical protein
MPPVFVDFASLGSIENDMYDYALMIFEKILAYNNNSCFSFNSYTNIQPNHNSPDLECEKEAPIQANLP